jgi:hypothetical protein
VGDIEATRTRLAELRGLRDQAQARVDQLGTAGDGEVVNADRDWEDLTTDERRALIRALVAAATVGPGRGAARVTVTFI